MKKHVRVALACALSMTAACAMAASSASASITGLTFTLVDLTPDDSNASFYDLQSALGYSSVSVQAKDATLNASESLSEDKGQFLWDRTLTSTQGNANVQASSSADGLSTSGFANGPSTYFFGSAGSISFTSYNTPYFAGTTGIQLAPHSMLIVSAQATATAWAGQAVCNDYDYKCPPIDASHAEATMSLVSTIQGPTGALADSSGFQGKVSATASAICACIRYGYDEATNSYHYFYQDGIDQSVTDSRRMTTVLVNDSDVMRGATLQLGVRVSGDALTAVPEPATYALQLLGLLAIGGVRFARRRTV